MFRTLIYPSPGTCDSAVELVSVLQASACNTDTTQTQPHQISNTQRTENKTTDLVIQQHSRKLLMMDILMSETCWVRKKWNKIASDNKLVFYSSTITMMHGPINIRLTAEFTGRATGERWIGGDSEESHQGPMEVIWRHILEDGLKPRNVLVNVASRLRLAYMTRSLALSKIVWSPKFRLWFRGNYQCDTPECALSWKCRSLYEILYREMFTSPQ